MRTLRLADGPDEVHRLSIARNELKNTYNFDKKRKPTRKIITEDTLSHTNLIAIGMSTTIWKIFR